MNRPTLLMAGIIMLALSYLIYEDAEASRECLKTHSEETCFYTLNH